MDRWIDGWMGGWVDGWMDGWMDGCVKVDACIHMGHMMHESPKPGRLSHASAATSTPPTTDTLIYKQLWHVHADVAERQNWQQGTQ